jgi:hypothetical protein
LFTFTFWQRRFLAVPVFRLGNFGRGTFRLDIELVRTAVSAFPCTLPEMRIGGVTAQAYSGSPETAAVVALVGFFQSIYLREKSANLLKCVVIVLPRRKLASSP